MIHLYIAVTSKNRLCVALGIKVILISLESLDHVPFYDKARMCISTNIFSYLRNIQPPI